MNERDGVYQEYLRQLRAQPEPTCPICGSTDLYDSREGGSRGWQVRTVTHCKVCDWNNDDLAAHAAKVVRQATGTPRRVDPRRRDEDEGAPFTHGGPYAQSHPSDERPDASQPDDVCPDCGGKGWIAGFGTCQRCGGE